MKTVAIIPARTDSKRLPGKHLRRIAGHAMLYYLVERLRGTPSIDCIILATTQRSCDDPLVDWAEAASICTFRGDVEDVLGRFAAASAYFGADVVVKANGDNPLLSPEVITAGLSDMAEFSYDFVTGKGAYTGIPIGLGAEIIRSDTLERLNDEATSNSHRENVTTFIFDNPQCFRWAPITIQPSWSAPEVSLTVDTLEEFDRVNSVVLALGSTFPQEWTVEEIINSYRAVSSSG